MGVVAPHHELGGTAAERRRARGRDGRFAARRRRGGNIAARGKAEEQAAGGGFHGFDGAHGWTSPRPGAARQFRR
jgi:hypothetical protein